MKKFLTSLAVSGAAIALALVMVGATAQTAAPAAAPAATAKADEAPKAAVAAPAATAPAAAEAAAPAPVPNKGDTAWMTVATLLVILMAVPGLALFYGGLVRKKNVLATMMQSFAMMAVITVLWGIVAYSLCFAPGNAVIGGAIGDTPIIARAQGIPVKAVAVLGAGSLMQMVTHKDAKIESPRELKGKVITTIAYTDTTYYAMLGM